MSSRLGGFIAGQNINVSIGTFTAVTSPTFTFASTQATPPVGQAVQFTTTGTLPTGLSANTTYYVISTSTNTCQFSTTISGSAVTFTNSSGSGTHTAVTQRVFNSYAGAPDTVEYLVVAGGGSGGGYFGGGGGAGGLLSGNNYAVTSGTALTVTVGAGGASVLNQVDGNTGSNSVFGGITASGGGYGAGYSGPGGAGGSGGGGTIYSRAGGTGIAGQGFAGGYTPSSDGVHLGGGGGGAGAFGSSGGVVFGSGHGGAGLCSTITGARVFYAGGGGSATASAAMFGLGGGGGGGNGGLNNSGVSGIGNTGGGGGGQPNQTSGFYSGAGGSGIVIVRYPQVNAAPALVTGSPQVLYSDNYQIYVFTSSGSIIF